MTALQFAWSIEKDHWAPSGKRYVLRSPSLPKGSMSPLCADDRVGCCSWDGKRRWRAAFWIDYDEIYFVCGTPRSAMNALERELCKRSIGLFNVDDIEFAEA